MSSRQSRPAPGWSMAALVCILGAFATEAVAQTPAPPGPDPLVKDALVGGLDVNVPARKKYVAPEYPAEAAAEGIRGIVILQLIVGEDGSVLDARVTRSIPGLDEAAVAAVKMWEYEPTSVDGRPVKVLLSQSITFALRLPELLREVGVPELKSGGAPPVPQSLDTEESASLRITLDPQGNVIDATEPDGNPVVGDALLRAVRSWRFTMSTEEAPSSFTISADWTPGPKPRLELRAYDLETESPESADARRTAQAGAGTATAPPSPDDVETEVLPARPEPPQKEEGVSAITDVTLGENIPDLVKGRRPTLPPMARLGNAVGDVIVRFTVDLAGRSTVHSVEGPDLLKDAAQQAVGTWLFRRTAIDRLNLVATFTYDMERSVAKVVRVE